MSELENKDNIKEVIEWILCIVIAVILALLVRHFIFTPTVVHQLSMYPTLKQGDRLILNRLCITMNDEFERGEIITFEKPEVISVSAHEYNKDNPVAIYNEEKKGIFSSFTYYVLEIGKESYIKRLIGLPGDHILIENGKVYINGTEQEESYLQDSVETDARIFNDFTVPEGYIFAMGDNRKDSIDCRNFGCIPIEKVESKVAVRFWPLDKIGKV